MFNIKTGLILGLSILFLTGCAGTKVSASRPVPPAKGICAGETSGEDRVICLRAQEIEAQKQAESARKELTRLATPAEKQATKEIRGSENDQRRFQMAEKQVFAQARVAGCESGTVWVNPELVVSSLLPGILRRFTVAPYISVRFYNPRSNGEPVKIEATDYGPVVENLCVGGSVTVYRQFRYGYDAQYVRYSYKVIGMQSGGFQNTGQYSLWVDTMGNGVATPNQSYDWDIQIRK